MAFTYTNSLRFTKQGVGDNPNTWGIYVNSGDFDMMDQAVAGVISIDISVPNNSPPTNIYILSARNGVSDEARNMVLRFTGTLTQDMFVQIPDVTKFYLVSNQTSGAFSVTMQTGLGTTLGVAQGINRLVYCDGINVLPGDPVAGLAGYGTNAAPSYAATQDASTGYNILNPSPSATGILTLAVSGQEAIRINETGTGFGRDTINSRINIAGRVENTPIALTPSATVIWDLSLSNIFTLAINQNAVLANPTNMVAGTYYALSITQDGVGNRTLSYGSAYSWGRAGTPTLSITPNTTDLMLFYCDGTHMLGTVNYGYTG